MHVPGAHFAPLSCVFPFDELESVQSGSDDLTMDKMTCWTLCLSGQSGPDDVGLEASDLQAAVRREVVSPG